MLQLTHGLCTQVTVGYRCRDEEESNDGSSNSYGIAYPCHLDADGTAVILIIVAEFEQMWLFCLFLQGYNGSFAGNCRLRLLHFLGNFVFQPFERERPQTIEVG